MTEEEIRATEYIVNNYTNSIKDAYVAGALEQQKIDISRAMDIFHRYLLKKHNISDDEFNVLKNIFEEHIIYGEAHYISK